MNGLEKFYDISLSELDASNLFFSVISKCKEKGIFDESELVYIDSELGFMIEETARFCGKGYIKQDSARIMLKNIFMILDGVYSVSEYTEIISAVKHRQLRNMWQCGVRKSIAYFDRTVKNFYHLEHFYYKNPVLMADFAIKLKNDYGFSNIYTHSFERAQFTKAFFAISGNESFKYVCERSEILCTECAFLEKLRYSDLVPILDARGFYRVDGGIKYTSALIDAIVIGMCYAAFYRCDGVYPEKKYGSDILSELVSSSESELCESFYSYLGIAAARYGVEIHEKSESVGENILNVYASRACNENIELLSEFLAGVVCRKRKDEKGLRTLIHFI